METPSIPPPADEVLRLRSECEALKARLASYEDSRARWWGLVGWTATKSRHFIVGTELDTALTRLMAKLRTRELPTDEEVGHAVAAVIRRFVRISMVAVFAFVVALLADAILLWQTLIMREQNTLIARQNEFFRSQNEYLLLQTEQRRLDEQERDLGRVYGLALQARRLATAFDALLQGREGYRAEIVFSDLSSFRLYLQDAFSETGTLPANLAGHLNEAYQDLPTQAEIVAIHGREGYHEVFRHTKERLISLACAIETSKTELDVQTSLLRERLRESLTVPEVRALVGQGARSR